MPYIQTEPVESSNIKRIGYDRRQQILRIIFHGERAYDYPMVTERDFKDLMAAESKGRFFNARIKPLYAPRTPREAELVKPCCEHDGPDTTCTEECYPCHDWCCPGGSTGSSPQDISEAIQGGRKFGASFHTKTDEESVLVDSDSDTVISIISTDEDEKACLHPNIESMSDGSNPVCAACGVDLSQSGDCTHGADGRTCEEGCGCIPCHEPQDESPEVQEHSKALNEKNEVTEGEETHGNSD